LLDAAGVAYRINPRLVRGLDYYNLTVFEWVTDRLGAQSAVCAGGRYDPLIAQLGGKPAPAVGWGMGIERVLLLLAEAGIEAPAAAPTVYAVVPDAAAAMVALETCETLRSAGVSVQMHAAGESGWGSMKAQFRRADASGARFALIFGADELARGEVALKPLRDSAAPQRPWRCSKQLVGHRNSSHNRAFLSFGFHGHPPRLEEQEQLDQLKSFWKQYGT
jgi:histidyl-tRNA synthetase